MLAPSDASTTVLVRDMAADDLRFSAELHCRCLPHGLFPSLGPRFMAAYIELFRDSPHAVAYVAEVDREVVGYLVGTLEPAAHARWVARRRALRLALLGVLALLTRPSVAVRFLRTRALRYVAALARHWRPRGDASGAAVRPSAVLSHVAVSPDRRGHGAGGLLVDHFMVRVAESGVGSARLVTRRDAGGAGGFYRSLGWSEGRSFTDRDGMDWTTYERQAR